MSDFEKPMGVLEAEARVGEEMHLASLQAAREAGEAARARGMTAQEIHASASIAKAVMVALDNSLEQYPDLRAYAVIEHAFELLDAAFGAGIKVHQRHIAGGN